MDRGAWTANTVKRPQQQPAQPPIRQLLGATDVQTAHATFGTPTTGLHERGNDTSRSTGRSGRQNAATRRNMRREERPTVQGPVKEQQPDGMSHRGRAAHRFAHAIDGASLRAAAPVVASGGGSQGRGVPAWGWGSGGIRRRAVPCFPAMVTLVWRGGGSSYGCRPF